MSTGVNTGADGPPLWVPISELARLKVQDKAWISRKVAKFEQDRLITTRKGPRGTKLVNRAEYDRLVHDTGDHAHEQAAATLRETRMGEESLPLAEPAATPKPPSDPTRRDADTQRAIYEAELKKLDLAERRGLVVAIIKLTEALHRLANAIVQLIDRLPLRAGEIAAAVARDGEIGARAVLKVIAFELRSGIASAFKKFEAEGLAEESAGPIEVDTPDEDAA